MHFLFFLLEVEPHFHIVIIVAELCQRLEHIGVYQFAQQTHQGEKLVGFKLHMQMVALAIGLPLYLHQHAMQFPK